QMWVSPQSFDKKWMDEFLAILQTEPAWLGGIVHGPQVRMSLKQLRDVVPKKYPIRNYPDITHSLRCQFPVPDWDAAFAVTQGRVAWEQNVHGPVLTNAGITANVQQFQAMEKTATPQDKLNWRFQQALYRAYYDAYVRSRLLYETQLEEQAMGVLREAKQLGSLLAMNQAETQLDQAVV